MLRVVLWHLVEDVCLQTTVLQQSMSTLLKHPFIRSRKLLFGLSFARGSIQRKGRMIIVEGYFDVIALHRQGFKETIATCGTALTPEHVQVLRPLARRAVALFDTDEAGVRAAEKIIASLLGRAN